MTVSAANDKNSSTNAARGLAKTSLDRGVSFPMGRGRSRAVISPDLGMHSITLNNSYFEDGDEFPQHRHDVSEDCMIVISGAVSFKQGDVRTKISAGDFAWVPVGEVHGTINDSDFDAELISFQSPPDVALYRGERDKDAGSVPVPEGVLLAITGTLWSANDDPGSSITTAQGKLVFAEAIQLEKGEELELKPDGREHVLVILNSDGGEIWQAGAPDPTGARDVWFGKLTGPLRVVANAGRLLGIHAHAV